MEWIRRFQLFLFDFDGLLVNTEHLHFQAYINMMARRGLNLGWGYAQFMEYAHYGNEVVRDAIYTQFPDIEPNWQILYGEKKQAYRELISSGKVELMPGVKNLLEALEGNNIRRCVATHSTKESVDLISAQLKELRSIPHWITREDYEKPKPNPECYLRAIQLFGRPGDRIIGFEDSLRGLQALQQTSATAVLICPAHYPLLELAMEDGGFHFQSFEHISVKDLH